MASSIFFLPVCGVCGKRVSSEEKTVNVTSWKYLKYSCSMMIVDDELPYLPGEGH